MADGATYLTDRQTRFAPTTPPNAEAAHEKRIMIVVPKLSR